MAEMSDFYTQNRFLFLLLLCLMAIGCTVPGKFQEGKPFVFKNEIRIQPLKTDGSNAGVGLQKSEAQKLNLESRLMGQLDDSVRVRVKSYAGIIREVVNPPVYDSLAIRKSIQFMEALLESEGFFRSEIKDSTVFKAYPNGWREKITHRMAHLFSPSRARKKQIRAINYFTVNTGAVLRVDTLIWQISDSALQSLALQSAGNSGIKKGTAFSQGTVARELDRLSDYFKNNGYFGFTTDDLYAECDTINLALITADADPFEQLAVLEEAQKRRYRPTVKISIKLKNAADSGRFHPYQVGNVVIYPDLEVGDTTVFTSFQSKRIKDFLLLYKEEKFKPNFLSRQSRLEKDSLFRQVDYIRTVNAFNQLGAWKQVTVEPARLWEDSSGKKVDFNIKLVPAIRQSLILELEGSRNTGNDAFASGNLLGVGVNLGIRNKNVAREAIQSSTQLRAGIELNPSQNSDFILTRQINLSHSYSIPRIFIPFVRTDYRSRNARTIINANAGYTERKDFFNLGTINTSIAYEISRRNHLISFRPLNIELNSLVRKPGLDSLFRTNPLLQYNFSDGLIIGSGISYVHTKSRVGRFRYFKTTLEESGALTGLLFKGLYNDLFRFAKLDAEYRYFIEKPKHTWAFRLMGGYGYAYGANPDKNLTMPFFRQFFAGGPNSMRAWTVRSLGPGSTGVKDSVFNNSIPANLRLGDIQLEANIEYRFNLATIGGVKVKSAFFADMGNIWYRSNVKERSTDLRVVNLDFKLNRLYQDLAIAGGTSLRLDFDYFLIRLDWAYKIKDPFFADINAGWIQKFNLLSGQLQLGINHPF